MTGDPASRVPAEAVVLGTGTAFPDALSGVPLAKAKGGQLLLADGKQAAVAPAVPSCSPPTPRSASPPACTSPTR